MGSVPRQSTWNLRWTKWHWDKFFSAYFGFLLTVSLHQCSVRIFMFELFIWEGKAGEDREAMLCGMSVEHGTWKYFHRIFLQSESLHLQWSCSVLNNTWPWCPRGEGGVGDRLEHGQTDSLSVAQWLGVSLQIIINEQKIRWNKCSCQTVVT